MALIRREVFFPLIHSQAETSSTPEVERKALIEALSRAIQSNNRFEEDRPLLMAFNVFGGMPRLLKNLDGEMGELFTDTFDGFWADCPQDPHLMREYQRQELADIFIFALGGLKRLGLQADQIPVERIAKMAEAKTKEFRSLKAKAGRGSLSEATLQDFPALNTQLQFLHHQIQSVAELMGDDMLPEAKVFLFSVLHQLLIFAVTTYQVLGLDAGEAINEKIARNNIKYPARLLQMSEPLTGETLALRYREQANKCKQQFAMDELWPDEKPAEPKSQWQHLDKGSAAFYSIARSSEQADTRHNISEVRQVFYWVVNALIAH